MQLNKLLIVTFVFLSANAKAQKIESIFVNLYTDSLKKGTYNYINVDGKLSNGKYIPLDSTQIIFHANEGKFYGNNLWLDKDFKKEKVDIKVLLKENPALSKEFTIYIKLKPDNEKLPTSEEILKEKKSKKKEKREKKK